MTRRPDCPKCGQPVTEAVPHCPDFRCHWAKHGCGALVDLRHPARHIPYDPPRHTA